MKLKSLLFLPLIIFMAGCQAKAAPPTQGDNVAWVFIIHAKEGIMQNGKLVLHDVTPSVSYIHDRPSRESGAIELSELLKSWSKKSPTNFSKMPPNIWVVGMVDQSMETMAVELQEPVYDEQHKMLSFKGNLLDGRQIPNGKLTDLFIFIDSAL
ncbi:MAG: hypothetical protein S4CHLAM45_01450 [Chlamydiales bacterium]|nr:hypothetical protein [Chlamydiales bacterium]MCH9619465.1 hypothetical protein [Chlamydiales bacterium]MCH9622269.1 hypothetical protein [Chlamydiales bacterium]